MIFRYILIHVLVNNKIHTSSNSMALSIWWPWKFSSSFRMPNPWPIIKDVDSWYSFMTGVFRGDFGILLWNDLEGDFWRDLDDDFWGKLDGNFWGSDLNGEFWRSNLDGEFWRGDLDGDFWRGDLDSYLNCDFWSDLHGVFWNFDGVFWSDFDWVFWSDLDGVFWSDFDGDFWGSDLTDDFWSVFDGVFWGDLDGVFWSDLDGVFWESGLAGDFCWDWIPANASSSFNFNSLSFLLALGFDWCTGVLVGLLNILLDFLAFLLD